VLALPRRPLQLRAQHLGHVDLDDDLALEVATGVEVEVGVRRAREAIKASMTTSPIGIDRPPERHRRRLGHAIEGALGVDLVEVGVQRLRRVEAAHDGIPIAGQPGALFGLDLQVVPAHERMFARTADGTPPGAYAA
jgi:hypothetical protein